MIEKNKKITTLEQRLNENEQLGSRELIRHLNEEYGAGFSDGMVIECLSNLPNEDGDIDGYLDPYDLILDLPDLKEFLRWRYRLMITEKIRSAISALESGDRKTLQCDVAELIRFKSLANEIKSISDEFIDAANELINTVGETE